MHARTIALALVLCTSAFSQKGQFAVPDGAEMEKYPILAKPITLVQMADMHLHPVKLTEPKVVENHFRDLRDKSGRFALERLPAGTIVYADEAGKVRYKADCSNRLVEVPPPATAKAAGPAIGSAGGTSNHPPAREPLSWRGFTDWTRGLAKSIWNGIANFFAPFWWLMLAALGLLLLMGLVYLIYALVRSMFDGDGQGETPRPYPPARPTEPPAPAESARARAATAGAGTSNSPSGSANERRGFVRPTDAPAATEEKKGDSNTFFPADKRSFISFVPADEKNEHHMIKWQGVELHHFERDANGVHTVRFKHIS